ncbi:hypothetical protein GDO86_007176 [Hymenochirus boettgeri]|uniref:Uncharacterized protein n=1 Tax=Hymenochirus boettgeri TaxID=247094 RepID=A0A8T2IWB8_9PIPI|nr:hypothetical protein GDO86_007176 [Hymenochirus boettgeri]
MIGRNIHLTQNEGKEHEGELNIPQSIVPVPQPKKRKLVLHLDLNNTILVSDAATGQGPRAALNSYLSTVTWGKLSDSGEWCWLSDSLSLTVPCKDAISYYLQFGRNADFADTKMGKKFKEVFDHHLEKLEWKGEPNETFSQKGEDGKLYHWILPSFFHLLENLHQQGRDFCILLRTFGVDLPRLLPLIHSALMGQHPHFPQLRELPIHIDLTPGKIRCSAREAVLTQGPHRLSTKKNEGTLYEYFSNLSGIGGFQDHFDWFS